MFSELASHVQQFANSVEALFMSEKVLTLPTFTKSLCDSLDTSPARLLYQGMAKEIRVSPEDKRYALRVMKAGFLVLSDFLNFKNLSELLVSGGKSFLKLDSLDSAGMGGDYFEDSGSGISNLAPHQLLRRLSPCWSLLQRKETRPGNGSGADKIGPDL